MSKGKKEDGSLEVKGRVGWPWERIEESWLQVYEGANHSELGWDHTRQPIERKVSKKE
jgi:hypothetical protein